MRAYRTKTSEMMSEKSGVGVLGGPWRGTRLVGSVVPGFSVGGFVRSGIWFELGWVAPHWGKSWRDCPH